MARPTDRHAELSDQKLLKHSRGSALKGLAVE